jgi:glutamine amidotransferase-like uncharacterized protein
MIRKNSLLLPVFCTGLLAVLLLSSCSQAPAVLNDSIGESIVNQAQYYLEVPDVVDASDVADQPDSVLRSLRIAIYNGIGTWDLNVTALENFFVQNELRYELIDENDVTSISLKDRYDLIWFPGGSAGEYHYLIADLKPLVDFVDQGGYYVGSCAGAYFAADILSWLSEDGKDHDYPLSFFPGRAVGPLVSELNWGDEAVLLLNRDLTFNTAFDPALPVYYFDGPYFDAYPEADYLIMARYEANDQPAVVAGYFGDGKYLLFGPHPEMGGINEQSGDYDLEGGNNAQWNWLLAVLNWFGDWNQ